MFRHNYTTYLPLLLSGLPDFAMEWLRIAGIPTASLKSTLLCREGKNAAGQILIFDARNATGRMDARMARENGAEIVNVADLLPRDNKPSADGCSNNWQETANSQSIRVAFLNELKLRIEGAGGFWLRIADYPFPYQSAICLCPDPQQIANDFAAEVLVPAAGDLSTEPSVAIENDAAWLGRQHSAGQPVFCRDHRVPGFDGEFRPPHITEADEHPLMWQTTGDEFLAWTRLRTQISLVATKSGATYQIQWTGNPGRFRPTVELWLGNHVASLPLADRAMTFREEGILFVQEHRRPPAGVAASWSNGSQQPHIWTHPVHHSV